MILVLTTEAGDFSHLRFVDWLNYYNADYFILTGESIFTGRNKLTLIDNQLFINDINLTKEVNVVFNRRWLTTIELPKISEDKILNNDIKINLSREINELLDFLNINLSNALWIPDLKSTMVNKLAVLETAKNIGIDIPYYLVTNQKYKLLDFLQKHKQVITKAISNFKKLSTSDNILINPIYTKIVASDLAERLPDTFFMSMFQQYIPKEKEYRVLFFNDQFYTAELLTQENDFSTIDSRKVDKKDSDIRIIKSDLPNEVKTKLDLLMHKLNLNIGCIDLIKYQNRYYFLEVNPVGQIEGYSTRANLNFEKQVVEFMIEYDKAHS
ncbi:MAG: hypothetical protein Q4A56_02405 [Porphyromonadaceae bacterium]|nr:hypothetical protein [Porphyromonadaceae bacterium]